MNKFAFTGFLFFSICVSASAADLDVVLAAPVVWANSDASNTSIRITTPNQVVPNNWGCTDIDSYMVKSSLPQAVQNRIFSILTLAKATNVPVTIRVDGCEAGRPAIVGARL
ncbi:MAG: hypothetical protein EOP38_19645 [Rubrivivax sp.]|nr:MAG: hypothetical protein EOP38_19645 [Rubrivivax sp.]